MKVGKIIYIFEIESAVYCKIEINNKKIIENIGPQKLKNEIGSYFITVIDSDIYLTYCVDLDEHD